LLAYKRRYFSEKYSGARVFKGVFRTESRGGKTEKKIKICVSKTPFFTKKTFLQKHDFFLEKICPLEGRGSSPLVPLNIPIEAFKPH